MILRNVCRLCAAFLKIYAVFTVVPGVTVCHVSVYRTIFPYFETSLTSRNLRKDPCNLSNFETAKVKPIASIITHVSKITEEKNNIKTTKYFTTTYRDNRDSYLKVNIYKQKSNYLLHLPIFIQNTAPFSKFHTLFFVRVFIRRYAKFPLISHYFSPLLSNLYCTFFSSNYDDASISSYSSKQHNESFVSQNLSNICGGYMTTDDSVSLTLGTKTQLSNEQLFRTSVASSNDTALVNYTMSSGSTDVERPSFIVPFDTYVAKEEVGIRPPAYTYRPSSRSCKAEPINSELSPSFRNLPIFENAPGNRFRNRLLQEIDNISKEGIVDAYSFLDSWNSGIVDIEEHEKFGDSEFVYPNGNLSIDPKRKQVINVDLFVTELDENSAILPGEKCVIQFLDDREKLRLMNSFRNIKASALFIGWAKANLPTDKQKLEILQKYPNNTMESVNVNLLKYCALATPTNILADDSESNKLCMEIIGRCEILGIMNYHTRNFRAKVIPLEDSNEDNYPSNFVSDSSNRQNIDTYVTVHQEKIYDYSLPKEHANKDSTKILINTALSLYDSCNTAEYKYYKLLNNQEKCDEIKRRLPVIDKINNVMKNFYNVNNEKVNEMISFIVLEFHADAYAKIAALEVTSTAKRLWFANNILQSKLNFLKKQVASLKGSEI